MFASDTMEHFSIRVRYNDPTLTLLNLDQNIIITSENSINFADALTHNTHFKELYISNLNHIIAVMIGNILSTNNSIKYLGIYDSTISRNMAIEIARGLSVNNSLISLDLGDQGMNNYIEDSMYIILYGLNKSNINTFIINKYTFTQSEATILVNNKKIITLILCYIINIEYILDIFNINTSITQLYIYYTNTKSIANMLKTNKTLIYLHLYGLDIDIPDNIKIVKALTFNNTLVEIKHIYTGDYHLLLEDIYSQMLEINFMLKLINLFCSSSNVKRLLEINRNLHTSIIEQKISTTMAQKLYLCNIDYSDLPYIPQEIWDYIHMMGLTTKESKYYNYMNIKRIKRNIKMIKL